MRFSVLVAVAACTSSSPAPQTPMVNTGDDGKAAETHRWREAMVNATLVALAAGDTAALVSLADPGSVFDRGSDCEHHRREELGKAADKSKGLKVEVVGMSFEQPSRDSNRMHVERGASLRGCVAKERLALHDIQLKVRVERDGKQVRRSARIQLVEANGRYYLSRAPDNLADGSSSSEAIAKMREFTNRMCACTDKACADNVQEGFTKWGTEMAKSAEPDDKPDPDMIKEAGEIMTRYTECMTKLMTMGMP